MMGYGFSEKPNKRFCLGVDGGGTKTEFVLFSEDGKIEKRIVLGACNPNSVGIDKCLEILKCGIDGMLADCSAICAVYIGAAGFLLGNKAEIVKENLIEHYAGLNMNIECNSDILNVIACADSDNNNCIAVICGTGFSVLSKVNDDLILHSGWGYLINKLGSGFDIGRDGLNSALAYFEGIGNYTILKDMIEESKGKNIKEILQEVYLKGQTYVASFAEIVFEAYLKDDEVAKKIIEENALYVADTVNLICKKYAEITKVVLSGSLFTKTDIYKKIVENQLDDRLEAVVPEFPQIYGACIKAAQMCDVNLNALKENFITQYRKCEK
jgi:N-acetylglucosamine kinase-like BadF-type ATPase